MGCLLQPQLYDLNIIILLNLMVEQYYTFTLVQRQQDNQFCKSNIILKDEENNILCNAVNRIICLQSI